MARYLTKSRFKLAMECPTKLYYTDKPDLYENQKKEDAFLQALAEGGYQVGELAKAYYPGGVLVDTLDYDEAVRQTDELLAQDTVIIYEAAFRYDNLFVRTDLIIKRGRELEIIEVKSTSHDGTGADGMSSKRDGTIRSKWLPYIQDVAFQKYVVTLAKPDLTVFASLMTADKDKACPTDGLNQKFRIQKSENGRVKASQVAPLNDLELVPANWILRKDPVDELCDLVYSAAYPAPDGGANELDFASLVARLTDQYQRNSKFQPFVKAACKGCEFRSTQPESAVPGLQSGFEECWREALGWQTADFQQPTLFDIGSLHYKTRDKLLQAGVIKLSEVPESAITEKDTGRPGLSQSQRQLLQLRMAHNQDDSVWIDQANLRAEMATWVYPLHFIDFETAMAAIPYNQGLHPYEGIAFQFSHHIVHADGRIEHKGQYLNATPGVFPNFDFVRALKNELSDDQGSIFRYAQHENTYLRIIHGQIQAHADQIPDAKELCHFIDSITEHKIPQLKDQKICGPRNMVDLCDLVRRYYYDPAMKGSVSIKKVLPSILNRSPYLQEKYAQPIYGVSGGIQSLNFSGKAWVQVVDGQVKDPYKQLRVLFENLPEDEDIELISDGESINQGGAAAMAYYRMQYDTMSDYERQEIQHALLEYCELDTLAMVMLYEGWREMI